MNLNKESSEDIKTISSMNIKLNFRYTRKNGMVFINLLDVINGMKLVSLNNQDCSSLEEFINLLDEQLEKYEH